MPAEGLIDAPLAGRCNRLLRRCGLRVTSARRIVLALNLHARGRERSNARALLRMAQAHGYDLPASTIYRVLNDLRAHGLLDARIALADAAPAST